MNVLKMGIKTGLALLLVAAGNVGSQESAATYPSKPVVVIIPGQGSGSGDFELRLYNEVIRKNNNKTYVIDYKPGSGGALGMSYVARANPDGYRLLNALSSLVTVPLFNADAGYDAVKDFAPITLLSKRYFMFVVPANSPFKNIQDYLAFAKANPGKINWAASGFGSSSQMPGALLHTMTGTEITYIYYKDGSSRFLDVVAGRVHIAAGTALSGFSHVRSGKMRAIAVSGQTRSKLLPDVPTVAESGVPGYEFSSWAGLLAPPKVPVYVVNRTYEIFAAASKDSDLIQKLEAEDASLVNTTPAAFRNFIAEENKRWTKVIKESGMKMEQ